MIRKVTRLVLNSILLALLALLYTADQTSARSETTCIICPGECPSSSEAAGELCANLCGEMRNVLSCGVDDFCDPNGWGKPTLICTDQDIDPERGPTR